MLHHQQDDHAGKQRRLGRLLYSTYFGGEQVVEGTEPALTTSGQAYATGLYQVEKDSDYAECVSSRNEHGATGGTCSRLRTYAIEESCGVAHDFGLGSDQHLAAVRINDRFNGP